MNRTEEREALYTAYSEKVRGYVFGKVTNRHDAEDLVSDVFLKAYEKYPTFDADRASVSTWLYTITRNTVISEGSGGISGGQRQRLMIARAIAPKPKILMFDEATSALDNITQKKVSESLDRLKCTRIVIAHRLSTIRQCDRILVLDQGKIVEDGTYDELIAANGFFAELVARQRLDDAPDAVS